MADDYNTRDDIKIDDVDKTEIDDASFQLKKMGESVYNPCQQDDDCLCHGDVLSLFDEDTSSFVEKNGVAEESVTSSGVEIDFSKPWRYEVKRIVSDGGDDYKNILRESGWSDSV